MRSDADIVMHSATKFIAGHSDVMAGVLAVNDSRCSSPLGACHPRSYHCWQCDDDDEEDEDVMMVMGMVMVMVMVMVMMMMMTMMMMGRMVMVMMMVMMIMVM